MAWPTFVGESQCRRVFHANGDPHVVGIAFETTQCDNDGWARSLPILQGRFLHLHSGIHVTRPTSTEHFGHERPFPAEELHCQSFGHLRWIVLPAILALVDAPLVGFCLVACQIREEAWEGHLHQRALFTRPGKLAEEVRGHR